MSLTGLPSSLTLASGAPLPFALQATDTADPSDALTYTVTSSNTALMNPIIPVGQSIQISTNVGNMTFELFTSLAPKTTQQFINMINAGDFNNSSSSSDTFYRIVQGFMIQGGPSPAPSVTSFANEYNPGLRFTTAGIMAMANTGAADSDSSQFFITDTAGGSMADLGFLDFNYSIFGFLTSGDSVRQQIAADGTNIATDPSAVGTPTQTVTINSISLITDTQHSVVLFAGAQAANGSGTVTITVSDQHGNTDQETIPFSTAPNSDYPAASVTMPAPTGIALLSTTPPAAGSTNGSQMFQVSGIQANATVALYADGQQVGTATAPAAGGTVDISGALSSGNHVLTAVQESSDEQSLGTNTSTSQPDITGNLVSPASSAVAIDVPVSTPLQFASAPFLYTAPGVTYSYIPSLEPGSTGTITYSLSGQTTGMTITNDVVTWQVPTTTSLGLTSPITLTATDSEGNVGTQTFRLTVVDLSNLTAPAGIDLALANSAGTPQISPSGTLVGTLSGDFSGVSSQLPVDDQLTYALVDDGTVSSGNAAFTIVGDQLFTNVTPPLTQAPYGISVRATNSNGLSVDQNLTINVINDTPTDIQLSYARAGGPLQFSRAGTLVGTLSSVDPYSPDSNTYSLVSGPGGADNASFTIVGNQLTAANLLTATSYSILVRTTDSVGLTFDKAFVIPVTPQQLPPGIVVVPVTTVNSGTLLAGSPFQPQSIFSTPAAVPPLPSVSLPAPTGNFSPAELTPPAQLFADNDLAGTKIGTSGSGGGPVNPDQPGEPQLDSGSGSTDTPGSPQPSGRDGTGNPQQRPSQQKTSARASADTDQVNIDADAVDAAMQRYAREEDRAAEALDG